jgi:hypothetical protein
LLTKEDGEVAAPALLNQAADVLELLVREESHEAEEEATSLLSSAISKKSYL